MARLSPVEAYRLWAASWDSSASPIVELERRYLSPWLRDLQGKIFVDVGCGTGRWMLHAAQSGARTIGVDISLEMLQQAAFKPGLGGRLAIADMTKLPLADESADIVLCALTLGHSRDAAAVLAELLRLPRAGGRVVVSDFHPEAIRNGWKRTFQCGSETLEVESFPYAVEALVEQARTSGYCLEQLLELSFGAEEEQIFLEAGRADLFARAANLPAVLLMCVRRL
jgi:malonyl-CoA O-methyltransferase